MSDDKLISENINLIYFVLKKLNLYNRCDEFFDIGMIGLIKGIKNFNPELGYKVSTYLCSTIRNEILMSMRKKELPTISFDDIIATDPNGNELTYHEITPSDVDIEKSIIEKEEIKLVYKCIDKLKDKEKFIICSLYGVNNHKQLTQSEIASKLNISQAQVSRLKNKTIAKIKTMLD